MTGPVSNAELLRWQRQAVTRLSTLLRRAQDAGFPVLSWSIGRTGGLIGTARDTTAAGRRAAFEVWCAYTGAQPWPERTRMDGTVRLYAVDRQPNGLARVVLEADLMPGDDTASGIDTETTDPTTGHTLTGEEC